MTASLHLCIDVGNSFVKIGVFESEILLYQSSFKPELCSEKLEKIFERFPTISHSVLSKVANLSEAVLSYLNSRTELLIISSDVLLPFNNQYSTPITLGVDRIALVAASELKYKKRNRLIIDAGSCITYDFIDVNSNYKGGAIAPGLTMRFKSLHTFTQNLPLLHINNNLQVDLIGNSTERSIRSGVINGMLAEIDGTINNYCHTYPELTVILTGGDTEFLSKRLKNRIFANSNFLLEGLNYLLAFNKHQ